MNQKTWTGIAASLACAACVGIHIVINKDVLSRNSPWNTIPLIVFFSMAMAAVPSLVVKERRKQLREWQYGHVWIVGHSTLASAGMITGWLGLMWINATLASLVSRFEVVLSVVCAAVFLGEKMTVAKMAGLSLAVCGVIVMSLHSKASSLAPWESLLHPAILLTLISAACYGTCEIFAVKAFRTVSTHTFVFYRSFFNLLFVGTTALFFGANLSVTSRDAVLLALSAFLGPYFGRILFMESLRRIPLSTSIGLNQTQPFFAAFLSLCLALELPQPGQWVGGIILLCGCWLIIAARHEAVAKN